jgi:hypothetical protein
MITIITASSQSPPQPLLSDDRVKTAVKMLFLKKTLSFVVTELRKWPKCVDRRGDYIEK